MGGYVACQPFAVAQGAFKDEASYLQGLALGHPIATESGSLPGEKLCSPFELCSLWERKGCQCDIPITLVAELRCLSAEDPGHFDP